MKHAWALLVAAGLWAGSVSAQEGAGFSAPGQGREIREIRPGKPEDLRGAKASGVIIMMSENGLQVINPLAPASLGIGQKTLSANIAREGRIGDEAHDRKPYGGIRLIGFEF